MEWLTSYKIPVGAWAKAGVAWLQAHGGAAFDVISGALQAVIDGILWLIQAPNPLIVIAIVTAGAWLVRRSVLFAVGIAIGVPIGIAAAHRPRLYAALRPILDLMQTLPSFVYLIPAIIFFGIGMV